MLNEVERNLLDAMNVARNVYAAPGIVPGGGALEMTVSQGLMAKSNSVEPKLRMVYRAVAQSLEIIPRTLAQNCGAATVKLVTGLRAKHAVAGNDNWGVDGCKGVMADTAALGIWEPLSVKMQTMKTAIEAAILLLRVDDVVSGVNKSGKAREAPREQEQPQMDMDQH